MPESNKPVLQTVEEENGKLIFTYNTGEIKEFAINTDKKGRYIEDTNSKNDLAKKYLLTNSDLQTKIKNNDFNFNYCIFLEKVDFENKTFREIVLFIETTFNQPAYFAGATFSKEADFRDATFSKRADFKGAIFSQNANFRDTTFSQMANFIGATFNQWANFIAATFNQPAYFAEATFSEMTNFIGATFNQRAYFIEATFNRRAYFEGAIFSQDADFRIATFSEIVTFREATFSKQADFIRAIFSEMANFIAATFSEMANFREATFSQEANFIHATFSEKAYFYLAQIELLIFDYLNSKKEENKKFQLNLQSAQINRMSYTNFNPKVQDVANRETFNVLKNIAIKQNDSIKALEFYKEEMEKHYQELEWSFANFSNKFILFFEKQVSGFGTSVPRALFWFVVFNAVLFDLYSLFYELPSLDTFAKIIIPFKAEKFTWIHLLSLVVNPILLYEIIKSFRKYSRRL